MRDALRRFQQTHEARLLGVILILVILVMPRGIVGLAAGFFKRRTHAS